MKNPVPAIRTEFLERVGLPGLDRQPTKNTFSADIDYFAAQHPHAFHMRLALHFAWHPRERHVQVMVFQPSALFERWDTADMNVFFEQLTLALHPSMQKYLPPWGNFFSCVRPFSLERNAPRQGLVYVSYIKSRSYTVDEVVELALASFDAGKDAVVFSKTIVEALIRKERVIDFKAHIIKMKRLIAREEKKFSTQPSSVMTH